MPRRPERSQMAAAVVYLLMGCGLATVGFCVARATGTASPFFFFSFASLLWVTPGLLYLRELLRTVLFRREIQVNLLKPASRVELGAVTELCDVCIFFEAAAHRYRGMIRLAGAGGEILAEHAMDHDVINTFSSFTSLRTAGRTGRGRQPYDPEILRCPANANISVIFDLVVIQQNAFLAQYHPTYQPEKMLFLGRAVENPYQHLWAKAAA